MSQVRTVNLMARIWAEVSGGFELLQRQELWGPSTHLLGWYCGVKAGMRLTAHFYAVSCTVLY